MALERAVLDRDRACAHRVEQRAVVRHEQQRAGKALERVLERLAALEVEVVGGLVEDQQVGVRLDEDREREAPPLSSAQLGHRLLHLLTREEEAAEQCACLARGEPGGALRRLEHVALVAELLGVLGEVAELHVVARAELAVLKRPPARECLDQRGLPRAVGAHQRDVLTALEPQLDVVKQLLVARLEVGVLEFENHPAAARRLVEAEAQAARVARVALDLLHLGELLRA